jgi:hypothetical protein
MRHDAGNALKLQENRDGIGTLPLNPLECGRSRGCRERTCRRVLAYDGMCSVEVKRKDPASNFTGSHPHHLHNRYACLTVLPTEIVQDCKLRQAHHREVCRLGNESSRGEAIKRAEPEFGPHLQRNSRYALYTSLENTSTKWRRPGVWHTGSALLCLHCYEETLQTLSVPSGSLGPECPQGM